MLMASYYWRATAMCAPMLVLLMLVGMLASPATAGGSSVGGAALGSNGVVVDPSVAATLPAGITAQSWIVADLDTGAVLAGKAVHAAHRPASTLKTLTALTLLPLVPASSQVLFTSEALAFTAQPDGRSTRVGLQPGIRYRADRLFGAMLALSANDAAEALASAAPGGRSGALAAMNAKARMLQADDTVAATPDGLDAPGQATSAYDLALIARAALALPSFAAADTQPQVELSSGSRSIGGVNHNRLLSNYPGAFAGKDGYTRKAGQVWWGAARRGGTRLVVVVMGAGADPVTQQMRLLDWGFGADGHTSPVGVLVHPLLTASSHVGHQRAGRLAIAASITARGPQAASDYEDYWLIALIGFGGALILVALHRVRGTKRLLSAASRYRP